MTCPFLRAHFSSSLEQSCCTLFSHIFCLSPPNSGTKVHLSSWSIAYDELCSHSQTTGFPSSLRPPSAQERQLGLITAAFPLMHALLFFVLTTHFVFMLQTDKNEKHKTPFCPHPFWLFVVDCKRLFKSRKIDFCHLNNLIFTNLLTPKQKPFTAQQDN